MIHKVNLGDLDSFVEQSTLRGNVSSPPPSSFIQVSSLSTIFTFNTMASCLEFCFGRFSWRARCERSCRGGVHTKVGFIL